MSEMISPPSKSWYTSKTVWAGIITAVLGILEAVGLGLPAGSVEVLSLSVVQIIMGVLAVYGRVTAVKTISKSKL